MVETRCANKRVKRPSSYQGPSWSWVPVIEPGERWLPKEQYDLKLAYGLDIVDATTELEAEYAPLGAVKSGSLVVRGRLQFGEWQQEGNCGATESDCHLA
jgi:hypothetical protein